MTKGNPQDEDPTGNEAARADLEERLELLRATLTVEERYVYDQINGGEPSSDEGLAAAALTARFGKTYGPSDVKRICQRLLEILQAAELL